MSETNVSGAKSSDERPEAERLREAEDIVRRNVYWAAGIGVVPVPLVDFLGITTVQVKMLKELSSHYEIRFWEHKVKNIVSSLIAGLGSVGIGGLAVYSLLKFVPLVGPVAGAVAIPIAAGAITHAMGKVFIQHFESGGTFLDFDPEATREYFREEYQAAKPVVEKQVKSKGTT